VLLCRWWVVGVAVGVRGETVCWNSAGVACLLCGVGKIRHLSW